MTGQGVSQHALDQHAVAVEDDQPEAVRRAGAAAVSSCKPHFHAALGVDAVRLVLMIVNI